MSSVYIDPIIYQSQPTGIITTAYIGNLFRLATQQAQGRTSLTGLPSSALTVALNPYDNLYLFDGPNSEVVQVGSGGAAIGASSIPLQAATLYAHNAGVVVCSDGTTGSLAQQIFTASQWVEDICHQALWQTTYAGEILRMPSMRASIDNQWCLNFKPRHVPVTSLSALTIQSDATNSTMYDPTQAIIDSELQSVSVPNLQGLPGGSNQGQGQVQWLRPARSRQATLWITVTYTAGFVTGALPWTVQRACSLLVNQCFVQLSNAVGADTIQQGKRNVTFALRGDQSGESLLLKEVHRLLQPYIVEEA